MKLIDRLKKKVERNSGLFTAFKWSFIGQIITRVINLGASIFLARLMSPIGYGRYIYLIGSLMFFAQLIGLSIRSSSIRNVAFLYDKNKKTCEKYIYSSLVIACFVSITGILLLLLLSFVIDDNIIIKEYDKKLLTIVLFAIFSEVFYAVSLGVLEGLKLFKPVNLVTVLIAILKVLFAVLGFCFFEVNGAIIGWVSASIIGLFFSTKKVFKGINYKGLTLSGNKITECKEEITLFIKFSLPSSLEVVAIMFAMWFIQTNILGYEDEGKKEIAIFNIANQWKAFVIYLPAIIINMLQSFFSGYQGAGSDSKIISLYKNTKKIIIYVSLCLSIIVIGCSDLIFLIFGNGYSEASVVLRIMVIPVVFVNLNTLNRHLLLSKGKVWFITMNNILSATLMIGLFFMLASLGLSKSFAASVAISEVFRFVLYIIFLRKRIIL